MGITARGPGKTREMVLRWYLRGLRGERLARKVGVSRQAVQRHLVNLRESGDLEPLERPA